MHRIHEQTVAERAVWGVCPVCNAQDLQPCDTTEHAEDVLMVEGNIPVHEIRFRKAPLKTRTHAY